MANRLGSYDDAADLQAAQDYADSLVTPAPQGFTHTYQPGWDAQLTEQEAANNNPLVFAPAMRESIGKAGDILSGKGVGPSEMGKRLLGIGQERYQTWPEQLVRSGFTLPHDVATGEVPVIDPATGHTSQQLIERAQDTAGLMGGGSVAGVGREATLASSGMRHLPGNEELSYLLKPKSKVDVIGKEDGVINQDGISNLAVANSPEGYAAHRLVYSEDGKIVGAMQVTKVPNSDAYKVANTYVDPEFRRQGIATKLNDYAKKVFGNVESSELEASPAGQAFRDSVLRSDTSANAPLSALAKPAPRFYSAVERAVTESKTNAATAEQWLGEIRNKPGVKQEELDWVLHELPEGKITKPELEQFVQSHKVELKEVSKGGYTDFDAMNELKVERVQVRQELDDARMNNKNLTGEERVKNLDRMKALADRDEAIGKEISNLNPVPTKFSTFQLPGGENYREHLLLMPERPHPLQAKRDQLNNRIGDIQEKQSRLDNSSDEYKILERERLNLIKEQNKVIDEQYKGGYQAPNFTSSHWDEPNVLAHIRTNERMIGGEQPKQQFAVFKDDKQISEGFDSGEKARSWARGQPWFGKEEKPSTIREIEGTPGTGLKSLHVEEIQSDLHQAGRKQGYVGELEKLEPEFVKIDKKLMDTADESILANPELDDALKMATDKGVITKAEAEVYKRYSKIEAAQGADEKPVPDFPFKQTWTDVALKRIIRMAAEEGKDAISWTPGEAQAARYRLSNHLKELQYLKNEDGTYEIAGIKIDGEGFNHPGKVTAAKLPDIVGKEMAEKIIKNEGKRTRGQNYNGGYFDGVDLKVGGQGMIKYYDKMLVDKANALAKKFGGKVEQAKIDPLSKAEREERHAIYSLPEKVRTPEQQARMEELDRRSDLENKNISGLHVLRITPQLRDAALSKGFSLFADTGKVGAPLAALSRVEHNPFQTGYHGTLKPGFDKFKVPSESYMLDQMLGVHVARDPKISDTFTIKDNTVGKTPDYQGGMYKVKIPEDSKFLEVNQPQFEYSAKRGDPKTNRNITSDQQAIEPLIMKTAFQKSPEMLARYLSEARAVPKDDALPLAKKMVAGEKVTLPVDGEGWDLDRFLRNFNGKPYNVADRAEAVKLFKDDMKEKGYVGLKYINTGPMETANAKDFTSYVVFEPSKHIRNALTGQLMSDTSANAPLSALAKQHGVKLTPVESNPFTTDAYHGSPSPLRGERIKPMSGIIIKETDGKFQVRDVVNQRDLGEFPTKEAAHDWVDKNAFADFYSTPNPNLASDYSGRYTRNERGSNVTPLKIDTSDYHTIDAKSQPWDAVNQFAINEANQLGKKGVIIRNVFDDPDPMRHSRGPQTVYITLDPSTVRSRFAKFDPAKFKESGLLKAAGVPFDISNQDGKDPFIDHSHDVPYGAGASNNGLIVHIDKSIPDRNSRTGDLDLHKPLALHERTEKSLMENGMKYEHAHKIATNVEKQFVEASGGNWDEYSKVMDSYLKHTEHEKITNAPRDLYLKPYPHDKRVLLEKHGTEDVGTPEMTLKLLSKRHKVNLKPVEGNPFG